MKPIPPRPEPNRPKPPSVPFAAFLLLFALYQSASGNLFEVSKWRSPNEWPVALWMERQEAALDEHLHFFIDAPIVWMGLVFWLAYCIMENLD